MKSFVEILNFIKEYNLDVHQAEVAAVVETELEIYEAKLTEEEFENVCKFVYDWIMNTEATPREVADYLIDEIEASDIYTYSNFLNYVREITDKINDRF